MHDAPDRERERSGEDRGRHRDAPSSEEQEHSREEQIELLLDGDRPQMQQRLLGGGHVEITGLAPELEIRREARRGEKAVRIADEIDREENEHGRDRCDRQHGEQRREDAAHAALVEARDGEAALIPLGHDQLRDQIAGDDEKYIDADETAAKRPDVIVEEKNR